MLSVSIIRQPSKKIIFVVTEDWYFCSHRLPLARYAKSEGYDVIVATSVSKYAEQILTEGFRLVPLKSMRRRSKNIYTELKAIFELTALYWAEKPDIVHHVAIKPVLYGSLAAMIARIRVRVNALGGLGYVFISNSWNARVFRKVLARFYRFLFRYPRLALILQNQDDCDELVRAGALFREQIVLIKGVGVDLNVYKPSPEAEGVISIILASRMLWDKGVGEFVQAAKILLDEGVEARFRLVGSEDPSNPTSISESQLRAWQESCIVEWAGHVEDMPGEFSRAHIVCLPSYREGVPKVLLEAAACGLPIVATDVPGCREVVMHNKNGLLVPAKDPVALAAALRQLIEDKLMRQRMGRYSRQIAEAEFSDSAVAQATMDIYRKLAI